MLTQQYSLKHEILERSWNKMCYEAKPVHVQPQRYKLDQTLRQLVAEALTYPQASWERRQKLNTIIRLVMRSGRLWKENTDSYSDAVQQTWEYCCQHLEEYDPTRAGVITWVDHYLKKRLRYFRDRKIREMSRTLPPLYHPDEGEVHPLDRVASRPDIQAVFEIWKSTLAWVEADPEGKLHQTCFRNYPEINAQTLFLKRFPHEKPWKEIAQEFNLTSAEAQDLPKFYNRKCLPLLRQFGEAQGYIEISKRSNRRKSI